MLTLLSTSLQSLVPISYFLAFLSSDYFAFNSLRPIGFAGVASTVTLAMGLVSFIWIKTTGGGGESTGLLVWKVSEHDEERSE